MADQSQIIGVIMPHTLRRAMATGFLGMLGFLTIYIAATHPPSDLPYLAILLGVGIGSLVLSATVWRATGRVIELTREELREQGGRTLARLDNIAAVNRGFFDFKPASGFALKLNDPMPGAFAPGLWWRLGRRVMIGGATAGSEAKALAELIRLIVAERDQLD